MLISFSSDKFQRDLSGGTGRGWGGGILLENQIKSNQIKSNPWWGCAAQFSKS